MTVGPRAVLARRSVLAGAGIVALGGLSACAEQPEPLPVRGGLPSGAAREGGQLLIAAHPDDDLFFMSPDLLGPLRDGTSGTTTVYATAGDAGEGYGYSRSRQDGVRSAYATMAGAADRWSARAHRVAGRVADVHVLLGAPSVRLVFLHMPDGGVGGEGFRSTGEESLLRLADDPAAVLHTVDGRNQTYTAADVVAVLRALMRWTAPAVLRTLDYTAPLDASDDHSDHLAIARFARTAAEGLEPMPGMKPYLGYPIAERAANVRGADLARKQAAFLAYSPHDGKVCATVSDCAAHPEGRWLERQYVAG